MKITLLPFIGLIIMALHTSTHAAAEIRCDAPAPMQQFKTGNDFGFFTSVTCSLQGDSSGKVSQIKNYYQKFIGNSPIFEWDRKFETVKKGKLAGVKLKATEFLTVTYGRIELPSEILLLDDNSEAFSFSAIVDKAHGSGDTSYMSARKVHVEAKLNDADSDTYTVTTSVEAVVKKPRFAPSFVFRNAVIAGMESDIKARALKHAELIVSGLTYDEAFGSLPGL